MLDHRHIDLLVIDDDDEFRGTMAKMFSRRGFRVIEASDGEQAESAAQRRAFDVAIMDMKMPGR